MVRGAEVLHSFFGTLSVTVHLSSASPFSLLRLLSSIISSAGTCPYRLCACTDPLPAERTNSSGFFFFFFSLQEFLQFLTHFADSHSDLALLGDLNFHYDDSAYSRVNRLQIALKQSDWLTGRKSKLRSCVNREVGLGSHSLSHSSPVPNKPYGFCGRAAPWRKNEEEWRKTRSYLLTYASRQCSMTVTSLEGGCRKPVLGS